MKLPSKGNWLCNVLFLYSRILFAFKDQSLGEGEDECVRNACKLSQAVVLVEDEVGKQIKSIR